MDKHVDDFNKVNSKILIVEDEDITALELKNKLTNYNYNILPPVSSGEDAIEISKKAKPNLILMDIMLDGNINGIEAAEEIKKFLDVPIIYITAYGGEETFQNAKITEPHAYILKPFDEKEVRYAIEIALYKHEMELELKEKERKFRLLYYEAPIAYQLLDLDGNILEVNQAWVDTTGYSREEVVGQYFGNFLESNDYYKFKENWNYYKDVGCQKTDLIMLCKGGSNLTVEFEIKSIYDDNMDFKEILCIFHNISPLKNEQIQIKESFIQKEMLLKEINSLLQKNQDKLINLINSRFPEIRKENVGFQQEIDQNEINNNELALFQEDIAFVDFAQYVESLVEDLLCSYNLDSTFNINLNVERVMLDLNTSLSYGLIINELLKNSINNHLFKRKICSVNIDFHLDNEKFILNIRDNYNNYPEIFESKASSFKLINTLIKLHNGTIGFDENKKSEIKIIFGIKS